MGGGNSKNEQVRVNQQQQQRRNMNPQQQMVQGNRQQQAQQQAFHGYQGQQGNRPQNAAEYNRLYQQYRLSQSNRGMQDYRQQQIFRQQQQNQQNAWAGAAKASAMQAQEKQDDGELKNFQLLSYIYSDSIKIQILDNQYLQVGFKVDTIENCNIRISMCVTEELNEMNVPVMFYTPNKTDYVKIINMMAGMKQEVIFGEINFALNKVINHELTETKGKYYPMIISINYSKNGQNFAFIDYCVFTKDSNQKITGARSVKQMVLINGLPFEIKSIFGLSNAEKLDGDQGQEIKGQSEEQQEECTICLSEPANCIIMPCGHMCVCMECGESVKKSKHNMCPVCRGAIANIVPLKRNK